MKFLKVTFPTTYKDQIIAVVTEAEPVDWSLDAGYGRYEQAMDIIVEPKNSQAMVDALQTVFSACPDWRINIMPLEASLPVPERITEELAAKEAEDEDEKPKKSANGALREGLVQKVNGDIESGQNRFNGICNRIWHGLAHYPLHASRLVEPGAS